MALIDIRQLTFSFPANPAPTLHGVDLQVEAGEFLALCGVSGSGKSTLLRHLKPALAPHGEKSGEIFFDGQPLGAISERQQSQEIGFVFQSPDDQIVTDKVWHELSFGMESLGYSSDHIRRRVAEMASFFGIEHWFEKSVEELSGGQKQLLNLAAVMVLQPKVLVLDEPTSQLDPVGTGEVFQVIQMLKEQYGMTIVMITHNSEEIARFADRVLVLHRGEVLATGTPRDIFANTEVLEKAWITAPQSSMLATAMAEEGIPLPEQLPITLDEGIEYLNRNFSKVVVK